MKVGDKVRVINKNFSTFGIVGIVLPKMETKTYEVKQYGTERIERKIFNHNYVFKDNEDIEVLLSRSVDDVIVGTYFKSDLEVLRED